MYDAGGNHGKISLIFRDLPISSWNQSKNKIFSSDNLSRLKTFNGPWGTGRFDYSADGDRTRKIRGNTISYGYTNNRMTSASGTSYSYNSDGDMTRMGNMYLDYTPLHRLWRIRQNGRTLATLGYDGNGKRIYKKTGSGTEIFLRGPDNNILADQAAAGTSIFSSTTGWLPRPVNPTGRLLSRPG
jgi:hypothetical protein